MMPRDDLPSTYELRRNPPAPYADAALPSRRAHLGQEPNPHAAWTSGQTSVIRHAALHEVEAKVCAAPHQVTPRTLQVQEGDTVVLHVTNADRHPGDYRGFGVVAYSVNTVIGPGETRDVRFIARTPGVYDFYCSDFTPAFCADVLGTLEVVPKGGVLSEYDNNDGAMKPQSSVSADLASPGSTDAPALSC